jgi:hypothetical protein
LNHTFSIVQSIVVSLVGASAVSVVVLVLVSAVMVGVSVVGV